MHSPMLLLRGYLRDAAEAPSVVLRCSPMRGIPDLRCGPELQITCSLTEVCIGMRDHVLCSLPEIRCCMRPLLASLCLEGSVRGVY